jgi:hypothetical protein
VRSGLGHPVAWYMVMKVLEEHAGSVCTVSRKNKAVRPD